MILIKPKITGTQVNKPVVGSPHDICVQEEQAGSHQTCCVCETSVPPPCRSEVEVAELCVAAVGVSLLQPASVFARASWVRAIATFPCWILSPGSSSIGSSRK